MPLCAKEQGNDRAVAIRKALGLRRKRQLNIARFAGMNLASLKGGFGVASEREHRGRYIGPSGSVREKTAVNAAINAAGE